MNLNDKCRQVINLANEIASSVQYSENKGEIGFCTSTVPFERVVTIYVFFTGMEYCVLVFECSGTEQFVSYAEAIARANDFCCQIGLIGFTPSTD